MLTAALLASAVVLLAGLAGCNSRVTMQDYRALCDQYEACPGDNFDDDYDSVEDCADDYRDTIEDRSGPCRAAAQDAVLCEIRNFQCNGRSERCDDVYDRLYDECDDDLR